MRDCDIHGRVRLAEWKITLYGGIVLYYCDACKQDVQRRYTRALPVVQPKYEKLEPEEPANG